MSKRHDHSLGVILAGGQGRRMFASGQGDKGLMMLAGEPVIARIITRLAPQTDGIVINANDDAARFATFGLPVVPDLTDTRDGPLAGLAASLAWAITYRPGIAAIVTVPSDVPFIPTNLVESLAAANTSGAPAVATSNGRLHPTIGLWPVSLLDIATARLAAGDRRMTAFAKHTKAIEVAFPFSDTGVGHVDPFFNLNTPEDVAAAERIAASIDQKQKTKSS